MGRPGTRSAAGLAGLSTAIVLASVSAAGAARQASSLRHDVSSLKARTHLALLDLYAIDTRLHAARSRLVALQAESARLRNEQALLEQQVAATTKTLARSRSTLGDELRMLYKQGDVSAFAVVLGAQSLDDAVTRLDELTSVADESKQIVEVATDAEARLANLRASLQERRNRVDVAAAEARRTADALASAHTERSGFISSLRSRQRLKTAEIATLQAAAQRVEHRSNVLQAAAATSIPSAAQPISDTTAPQQAPAASVGGGVRTITVSATGYSIAGRTATGLPTGWGVVAVDPSVIPLGTRLTIPGYGEGVAADTGGTVRGNTIDLWFPTAGQAAAWGRRTVTVTLH